LGWQEWFNDKITSKIRSNYDDVRYFEVETAQDDLAVCPLTDCPSLPALSVFYVARAEKAEKLRLSSWSACVPAWRSAYRHRCRRI
jgi:hypothetical protein